MDGDQVCARRGRRRSAEWTSAARPSSRGPSVLSSTILAAGVLYATSVTAQLALPHSALGTPLPAGADVVLTIDLGTLAQRPVLEVEAIPDAAHADMQLEIELTNFVGLVSVCAPRGPYGTELGIPLTPTSSFVSQPAIGTQTLAFSFFPCFPDATVYVGTSVDVRVRAIAFGSGGAPANVDVRVASRTLPPFNELFAAATGPRTVSIEPDPVDGFKDTTLYQDDPSTSNGAGEFLWAGREVFFAPPSPTIRQERRSLIAIDFTAAIPAGSIVHDAELVLRATSVLGGGGPVSLHKVAVDPVNPWIEGSANGFGSEFDGTFQNLAASWTYRRTATLAWQAPGGGFLAPALASRTITGVGSFSFGSSALAAAVQQMIDSGEDEDGFLLRGPGAAATETQAVQFASSDNASNGPQMFVTYTPATASSEGEFFAGTLSFIDEGQNLRWVYDTDGDDILETAIDGVCQVDGSGDLDLGLPYTYAYAGVPGFVGHDCCMWQITSTQSQIVGTGQAIFFHNLDPANPADAPLDSDFDAIVDACDNCVSTPNGPFLGTCVSGPTPGALCRSNRDCGPAGACDQSQTDDDFDGVGNACPEPRFATGLLIGGMALGIFSNRRRP